MSPPPVRLPIRRSRSEMRSGLAALFEGPPPYLSIYLDVSPGERRTTAAERLREAAHLREGVSQAQIEIAALGLAELSDEDALYAALVDAAGSIVWSGYPEPPAHEIVDLAPLPRMGPFLAAEQSLTHHVVGLVDHDELTLMVVPRHGDSTHQVMAFEGPGTAADRIEATARESQTTLVILCGPKLMLESLSPLVERALGIDATVVTLDTDELEERSSQLSEPDVEDDVAGVPVDRSDVADGALASAIVRAVANHAAEKTVGLLRLWRFHQTHGEAVDGVADCLAAIAGDHAALVLVHDDPNDHRWAWFGPEPRRVAVDLDHAAPIGSHEALQRARLVDVVLRSALLSGRGVHLVPNVATTLSEGIGVILDQRASAEDLASLLER